MKYSESLEVPIKSKLLDSSTGTIFELISKEDWYTPADSSPASIEYYSREDPHFDINKSYPLRFLVRKLFCIPRGRVFRSSRVVKLNVHRFTLYNYSVLNSYVEFQKKIITNLSTYCKDNIAIAAQNSLSSTNQNS